MNKSVHIKPFTRCPTWSKHSMKARYSTWNSRYKWKIGRDLNLEWKVALRVMKIVLKLRFFLRFHLSTHLLWFSFRSLGSWTLSSGLETSGLFSRRPAGILQDRGIFQTRWRSTQAAIITAGTTKTAMGQAVGMGSRQAWGRPQMSLANSPVALLLLLIRFNR